MRERDLQNYIFENPHVLFPGKSIRAKSREVFIEGRRIDLLFDVEGVQYIVELKADTIRRETIGQVFEYYALMKMTRATAEFRMILVAPSIPLFRKLPLEEFGISCVEIQHPPTTEVEEFALQQRVTKEEKQVAASFEGDTSFVGSGRVRFEDISPPVTSSSLQFAHCLQREGLLRVERRYPEYEVVPVKMVSSHSQDIFCLPGVAGLPDRFERGGAWWAYAFGQSDEMPKNDVPNISVCAMPWGLDFTVNAELRTSQGVMRRKIMHSISKFDGLVAAHEGLQLQAWLKIEHQPRFYHWVLLEKLVHGAWDGKKLLHVYDEAEAGYEGLRAKWTSWIQEQRPDLSAGQARHMNRMNRRLNLALRLARSFEDTNDVWNLDLNERREAFGAEYERMKPLIDFFQ